MTNTATYLINAQGKVLGRLATQVASLLRGKGKVSFVPYLDDGDAVVVINAAAIVLTGNKEEAKTYYHHTGYPGGIRATSVRQIREKGSGDLIRRAVYGMLPKNKLRDQFIKKLTVMSDDSYKKTGKEIGLDI